MGLLTVVRLNNAKPDQKMYYLPDGHGLSLQVNASGSKIWIWRYRFQGTPKMMSLGAYPLVSLKQARDLHFAKRQILASGVNPMAEKKAKAESEQKQDEERRLQVEHSFEKIARQWFEWWKVGKNKKYAGSTMASLENNVFPAIGDKFIDEVTAADIRAIMLAVEARPAREVARRAQNTIGQVFVFAITREMAVRNPAADFEPKNILKQAVVRHFPRIDTKDLPQLLIDIENYVGDRLTVLAMKLMVLVFLRTAEFVQSEWTEIDWIDEVWKKPKEHMKKVNNVALPHIIPLSRQALEILRALYLMTGHQKHIFPGDPKRGHRPGEEKHISKATIYEALKRMGYQGEMTGHGFRGVATTILHEQGFQKEHIDEALAHQKRDKVDAAYNYAKYLRQRREMMQWWADYVDKALEEGRRMRSAKAS